MTEARTAYRNKPRDSYFIGVVVIVVARKLQNKTFC